MIKWISFSSLALVAALVFLFFAFDRGGRADFSDAPSRGVRSELSEIEIFSLDRSRLGRLTHRSSLVNFGALARAEQIAELTVMALEGCFDSETAELFRPRSVYEIENGRRVALNFDSTARARMNLSALAELGALDSIKRTIMANFENVERIDILIDGARARYFLSHVEVWNPLIRSEDLYSITRGEDLLDEES